MDAQVLKARAEEMFGRPLTPYQEGTLAWFAAREPEVEVGELDGRPVLVLLYADPHGRRTSANGRAL